MSVRYPKEVHNFIRENIVGKTCKEMAAMVNERFGTAFTEAKMKSYKQNHKLKSGTPCGHIKGAPTKLFPEHIATFIRENHKGIGPTEMTGILNDIFGTTYTATQIKTFYGRSGLNSGVTGWFVKGQESPNKGRKGYCAPGAEKGWFQKGHVPVTHLPVGTVSKRKDGIWVKVAEPNVWKMKHRMVWEEHNGPIPKGGMITFLDGDHYNTDISNLELINNEINLELMRSDLRCSDVELTKAGIALATINCAISKKAKEVENEIKQRRNGKA